jgi:hypothetical protein
MKTKAIGALLLLLSLLTNYVMYKDSKNPAISGRGDPHWSDFSVEVDGYIYWNDTNLQPKDIRQFYSIRVDTINKTCMLLDVLEFIPKRVFLSLADIRQCELLSFNTEEKLAFIKYDDITLTVNKDKAIFSSNNPEERGGGELVSSLSNKIGWRLFYY